MGERVSMDTSAEESKTDAGQDTCYRTLVEWFPLPMVVHRGGAIIYANPAAVSLVGAKSDQELIGTSVLGWVHPDFHSAVLARMKSILQSGGTSLPMEQKFIRIDGSLIDIETQSTRVMFNGEPAVSVALIDITERKQALAVAQQYQAVVQASMDGFWITDGKGCIIEANDAVCKMHGYTRDQLIGLHIPDIEADETPELAAAHMRVMQDDGHVRFEARHMRRDRSVFYVDVSVLFVPTLGDRFYAFVRDITVHKLNQERLQLVANVFEHAREGIVVTDANARIIEVNQAFTRITGYSRSDVLGLNPSLLRSGRQSEVFYAAMWNVLVVQGHWNGELWNRNKSGDVYPVLMTISAVYDTQGHVKQYVGLFSDITKVKEHESRLDQIAHYDPLTNLPNRLLLADRLSQAMAQAQRRGHKVAVIYVDLDGFKAINDAHGHDVGDSLLIHVAARMKQALRDGDTLSRIGGDEFVAVLNDLDSSADSITLLARLLAAASEPLKHQAYLLQVTASIGATFFPQVQEIDAEQLLRQADHAMYQAKIAGKNRYHLFDADKDQSVRGLHESLDRVRRALSGNELVLHYQPKVNMRTGAIEGAEALIRWRHPERGLLLPAAFLPILENQALAVEVGDWVIRTCLQQMAQWQLLGLRLAVSANVSAMQLQQSDFVEKLKQMLAMQPDLVRHQLSLEVLETSALEDLQQVAKVIRECQKMGVNFSLDDFGTGYSSLTYLRRLPVTQLKIDQSFVRDMLDDADDLAILKGVIGLAHAFNREVIAEGVETKAHGQALLVLGCELAQGYGIARPMPAKEIPGWALSWTQNAVWAGAQALH
jgi:diguanylate cyclase (GGDEF)-like protein/PAS domain S-box-containing protein